MKTITLEIPDGAVITVTVNGQSYPLPTQDWPQKGDEIRWIDSEGEVYGGTFDNDYHRSLLDRGVIYHPDHAPFAVKVRAAQNRLDIAVMNRGDRNEFVEGAENWVVRPRDNGNMFTLRCKYLYNPEVITVRTEALAEYMIANHAADIVTVITKGRE